MEPLTLVGNLVHPSPKPLAWSACINPWEKLKIWFPVMSKFFLLNFSITFLSVLTDSHDFFAHSLGKDQVFIRTLTVPG